MGAVCFRIIILYLYADLTETVAVEMLNSTEPTDVDWITDYNSTQTTRLYRRSSSGKPVVNLF